MQMKVPLSLNCTKKVRRKLFQTKVAVEFFLNGMIRRYLASQAIMQAHWQGCEPF
jgi:hypothetical protein